MSQIMAQPHSGRIGPRGATTLSARIGVNPLAASSKRPTSPRFDSAVGVEEDTPPQVRGGPRNAGTSTVFTKLFTTFEGLFVPKKGNPIDCKAHNLRTTKMQGTEQGVSL